MKLKITITKSNNGEFINFNFNNEMFKINLFETDQEEIKKLFANIIVNIENMNKNLIKIEVDEEKSDKNEILLKVANEYKSMLEKEIKDIFDKKTYFSLIKKEK